MAWAQPQGEPWDISMNKEQALDWVKAQFGKEESFQRQADYYAQRHGDATAQLVPVTNIETNMPLTLAHAKGNTTDLIESTIGQRLNQVAAAQPEHPALIMPHQSSVGAMPEFALTEVDKLATGLLALGLSKGERVAIWSPNRFEWVLTQFATAKIGVIMVCINPAYRLYELEYALNKVGCTAIISAESFKTSFYLDMLQLSARA